MLRDERVYRLHDHPRRGSPLAKWIAAIAIGAAALVMATLAFA